MILGFDPSTKIIGYALCEDSPSLQILEIGKVELKGKTLPERYQEAANHIKTLLESIRPDYVGVETSFFGRNAGVAIKLGVMRGIISGLVYTLNDKVKLFEVTPAEERMALGIDTKKHADKSEIRRALEWQFPELKETKPTEDELDALAVAIATKGKMLSSKLQEAKDVSRYKLKALGR